MSIFFWTIFNGLQGVIRNPVRPAFALTGLMPRLFGGSLATLRLYQPDFALLMTAGAASGVAWAVFRLILAYRGGRPVSPA